jgi:hypothetical protein
MRVIRRLVSAALLAAAPGAAMAQPVVWDNGAPADGPAGFGLRSRTIVDDFTLGAPTAIGGIRFWGYNGTGFGFAYTGSIYWAIMAPPVSGIIPTTVLASGDVATLPTPDGVLGANSLYRFEFAIPTQALAAGTYWLAIHDGAAGSYGSGSFYAEVGPGNAVDLRTGTGTNRDFSFQLIGASAVVPEPATVVLTAGGLAVLALAGVRRRRLG